LIGESGANCAQIVTRFELTTVNCAAIAVRFVRMSASAALTCVSFGRIGARAHHRQSYVLTVARSDPTAARFLATGVNSAAICETGVVTFETCVEIEGMPDATKIAGIA
jgi:hypothetical protein